MTETFNSLWIGKTLGVTELLTLHSFADKGHFIDLWVYDDLKNVPSFITLKDANKIIPESQVFRYNTWGGIDWGKGSYGGFSDIFRYKLLFELGGWWVDMDVTCLKKFEVKEAYFFRNHWLLPVVGNIMKCPKNSELMKNCFQKASALVTKDNKDWHLPIRILNEEIEALQLLNYRKLGLFNLDMIHTIEPYLQKSYPFPADWMAVHWINSSNSNYKKGSSFHNLLKKYGIK